MHSVIHAFSNHVKVLHDVTPFMALQQTAVLSDGVVVACLYKLEKYFMYRRGEELKGSTRRKIGYNTRHSEIIKEKLSKN